MEGKHESQPFDMSAWERHQRESAAMDEDHEMAAPVGPVVDEDGFTMVTSKKKGGRR